MTNIALVQTLPQVRQALLDGRKDAARYALTHLVQQNPNDPEIWVYMAVVLPREQAIRALRRLLVLDPYSGPGLRGLELLRQNRGVAYELELRDLWQTEEPAQEDELETAVFGREMATMQLSLAKLGEEAPTMPEAFRVLSTTQPACPNSAASGPDEAISPVSLADFGLLKPVAQAQAADINSLKVPVSPVSAPAPSPLAASLPLVPLTEEMSASLAQVAGATAGEPPPSLPASQPELLVASKAAQPLSHLPAALVPPSEVISYRQDNPKSTTLAPVVVSLLFALLLVMLVVYFVFFGLAK